MGLTNLRLGLKTWTRVDLVGPQKKPAAPAAGATYPEVGGLTAPSKGGACHYHPLGVVLM